MDRVPVKVLLKLFSTLVSPILLYCCEIWGVYFLGRLTTTDMFKNKIFNVISDIDKLHQIQQCNKLRILNLVKPSWHVESYLSSVRNVKHRQAVTRFTGLAVSALKLFPVEVG